MEDPYKRGRRSGRKAEATKYDVLLNIAAALNGSCETNKISTRSINQRSSAQNRKRDNLWVEREEREIETHHCAVEHPFPQLQSRRVTDALLGPFRLGECCRKDTECRDSEGSEEPEG